MPTALKTANYKAAVLSGVAESILSINCTKHFDFIMYCGLFQVVIIPVKEIPSQERICFLERGNDDYLHLLQSVYSHIGLPVLW